MLEIIIPGLELYNEETNEFTCYDDVKLELEHSLISISKWESKWCKPFLSKQDKTREETIDYIKCMTLTQHVDEEVYDRLSDENFKEINAYINAKMTATWFSKTENEKQNREQVTAELIYYWMIGFNIPLECQKWHLNRLMTLIRVCNEKNKPPKKKSQKEIMNHHKAVNAARRKQHRKKG